MKNSQRYQLVGWSWRGKVATRWSTPWGQPRNSRCGSDGAWPRITKPMAHIYREKSLSRMKQKRWMAVFKFLYILYYQSPYGHIISIHVMVNHIRSHRSLREREIWQKKQWPGIGTWNSSPEIQAVLLPDMVYGCLYAWSMSQKKKRKEKEKSETRNRWRDRCKCRTRHGIGEKQKDY